MATSEWIESADRAGRATPPKLGDCLVAEIRRGDL